MRNRIATLPGTPKRIRQPVRWDIEDKLDLPTEGASGMLPCQVRIEVTGGRNSTRSTMRAVRVHTALQDVGTTGETVELDEDHATVTAEADRKQVLHVARLPFVKRVSAC